MLGYEMTVGGCGYVVAGVPYRHFVAGSDQAELAIDKVKLWTEVSVPDFRVLQGTLLQFFET